MSYHHISHEDPCGEANCIHEDFAANSHVGLKSAMTIVHIWSQSPSDSMHQRVVFSDIQGIACRADHTACGPPVISLSIYSSHVITMMVVRPAT